MQNQPSCSQSEWKLKESVSHVLKIFWHSIAEWPVWTTTSKATEEQERPEGPRGHKGTSVSDVSAPECVQVNHLINTCRMNTSSHVRESNQTKKKLNLWGNLSSMINLARSNQFHYLAFPCPTDLNLFSPTPKKYYEKKAEEWLIFQYETTWPCTPLGRVFP